MEREKNTSTREFTELLQNRHSVRRFRNAPVTPEDLQYILESANRAPSAGNLQAYEVYILCDRIKQEALTKAALEQESISQAPLVLVFCTNAERSKQKYGQRGEDLYAVQDATIATAYAQLAATAKGLGTVWVGAFDEKAVIQLLGLNEGLRPVAILPIGYPDEVPESTSRRELDNLVHRIDN